MFYTLMLFIRLVIYVIYFHAPSPLLPKAVVLNRDCSKVIVRVKHVETIQGYDLCVTMDKGKISILIKCILHSNNNHYNLDEQFIGI